MQPTSQTPNSRHRLILLFAGLAFAAFCRLAAGQTIPVAANMIDGSNNPVSGAYLHFDLYNCGPNYPTLSSFTIPGSISGGVFSPGETVKQTTTNVAAVLLSSSPFVVANLSSRTANGSSNWIGQTSGAAFTPSGVPAGGQIIVQRSFDLQQNSSGLISGTVVPNDLISCGNQFSTQWTVTPMKGGATPLNAAQRYFVCSIAGTGTPPCAQAAAGATFDPSTAQPAQTVPQPPGYSLTYANPVATQSISQPAGTQFNWSGTVNFCSATVLCAGSGGGGTITGSGASGSFTGWTSPTGIGNAPCTFAGLNIACAGTGTFANTLLIGSSAPTVCGTATNCIGFNLSTGSVAPILGQAGLHFLTDGMHCTVNNVSDTLGCGAINGPTSGGGLTQTGVSLGLLTSCSSTQVLAWNGSAWACAANGGGGGGNPILENCTPDQTGNSFYNVAPLTNYFFASWQFVFGQAGSINCTIFIPAAQTGATIVLDIAANDATAGHTANFQTCDVVVNSGTINAGSLTCAANQTFTTTSTAYNRVTLTFNVQSTLSNNSLLIVKIATSTTGTAPTANLLVYPHFIL